MGRHERHDVDYFPFFVKDGKTLFILENKYGCKGTGFFTNVLRVLALAPDHHFCIEDPADRMMFFAKCKCDEESGMDMLEIMIKTGKLNRELFRRKSVITSEDFLNSIQDAYRKRSNTCVTIQDIQNYYNSFPAEETPKTAEEKTTPPPKNDISSGNLQEKSAGNTQSKVKKSKVNNIYVFYNSKIDSEQKSSQRAQSNIEHWFNHYPEEELIASINNYSLLALKRNREHRKDPANFFQKRDPAFKDYLPGVFKPPNQSQQSVPGDKTPDPYFCKLCRKKKPVMAKPGVCVDCQQGKPGNGESPPMKSDHPPPVKSVRSMVGKIGKDIHDPFPLDDDAGKAKIREQAERLRRQEKEQLPEEDWVP